MVPIRVQVWYLYDSREDSTWKKHDRPEWASPSIMPGQTWRDNGPKALMPVITGAV